MRATASGLLLALAALAACPLPQPLPEVARTSPGGTAVSTPIILPDTATPPETVTLVRRDCAGGAKIPLGLTIEDIDTAETVEVRWFLNYGLAGALLLDDYNVPASTNANDARRPVPPLVFQPYPAGATAPRPVDVVEAVISNGFLATSDLTPPVQRAAAPPYVTQAYRWVFQYVDAPDGRCE